MINKVVQPCSKCNKPTIHHVADKLRRCSECKLVTSSDDKVPVNKDTLIREDDLAVGLVYSSPLSHMDVTIIGFAGDEVLYRVVGHDYSFLKHNRVNKERFVMWCNGDTEHVRR